MALIGRMRHKIIFQVQTDTADGRGGYTTTWATDITARAEIKPLRAYEGQDGERKEHIATHEIRCRHRDGITSKHRILFGSRVFEINQVLNLYEKGRYVRILATEDDGE